MTILVDRPRWPAHGTRFAHLVSDVSLEELHTFEAALALPRRLRFHNDHYDVPGTRVARRRRRGRVGGDDARARPPHPGGRSAGPAYFGWNRTAPSRRMTVPLR